MDGFAFQVEVVRTARKKSVSIQLDGKLVRCRVPHRLSDRRVRQLIEEKTPWIERKLQQLAERPKQAARQFVTGELVTYLGQDCRLQIAEGTPQFAVLKGNCLMVTADTEENLEEDRQATLKAILQNWYQQQADAHLRARTQALASAIGVQPASIRVKPYKARWGSCSIAREISYNWKLIFAPPHIIDYVVIHELCHILEHNHSAAFWAHVARYVPQWKDCRKWLRTHGHTLDL